MSTLGQMADHIRSKNAGPFWLTIDVFCGDAARFGHIARSLDTQEVAKAFQIGVSDLHRFDIPDLNVIKLSMPRPTVQGTRKDRDMHGAAWSVLLSGFPLPPMAEK